LNEQTEVDLKITGGTVVTASGPRRAGIAADAGRIVAVAEDHLLPPSRETYDASGKHVIPGLVDTEAHPGCYVPLKDDIATGQPSPRG
jgi:dihydropyrimidinase/dihydroorotase